VYVGFVNAGFLIFLSKYFAARVIIKFDNAGFGNSGKVTCRCECRICQCQIFDIFTKVFCRQCNYSNLAMSDLGILAK